MLSLLLPLLLLPTILARTDLAGCTSSASGSSLIWAVPGTGELCIFLDCGGGRAPPKTTVPGCPAYVGTETYSPLFLPSPTAEPTTVVEETSTITSAPGSVETGNGGEESTAVEQVSGSEVVLESSLVETTTSALPLETSLAATTSSPTSSVAQTTALPTITGSSGAGRAGGKAGVVMAGVGMLVGML